MDSLLDDNTQETLSKIAERLGGGKTVLVEKTGSSYRAKVRKAVQQFEYETIGKTPQMAVEKLWEKLEKERMRKEKKYGT